MVTRITPRGERLGIRRHRYQGKEGWRVYGIGGNGWPTSIFTESRTSAEKIRERLYAGEEIEREDWQLKDAETY